MKYKIISAVSVVLLLVLPLALQALRSDSAVSRARGRYIQHLEAPKEQSASSATDPAHFQTHLPVVEIDTDDIPVPGSWILNAQGARTGTETVNGQEQIEAHIRWIDHDTSVKTYKDDGLDTRALIRIRGNSSRAFDKKSYQIKLIDEKGNEEKAQLFGMGAHDNWALYGPYLDKTLIRNYLLMNVSASVMGYAPEVRFCEVFLNGRYQGLYVLMETIRKGGSRINIETYEPGKAEFDYILRIDRNDPDSRVVNSFSTYTFRQEMLGSSAGVQVIYPPASKLDEKGLKYIEDNLSAFEKALYSSDYRSASRGYRRYIDVDSFVDYYVLQEFLAISDAGTRSTYLYRDRSGKIKIGPVWDYNNAWNNYFMPFDEEGSEFMLVDRIWYDRLLSDPYFNEKVIERYRELRKTFLSDEALLSEMDEIVDYLGSAVGRNKSVWGYAYDPSLLDGDQKLFPDERNPENYESALEQMKEYMRRRGAWMDRHIDSLRQYAHSSRTEKYETR